MNILSDVEAAYVAGIIDGEGTITLTRTHRGENRRPVVSISSTELPLLMCNRSSARVASPEKCAPGSITHRASLTPSRAAKLCSYWRRSAPFCARINPNVRVSCSKNMSASPLAMAVTRRSNAKRARNWRLASSQFPHARELRGVLLISLSR